MPAFDAEVRNFARIKPVGSERLVLASDATASLLRVITAGLFVSTSPDNGRVLRFRKFVYNKLIPVVINWREREIGHIITSHRFCELSNSLLRI
jgi:hypothetical protein